MIKPYLETTGNCVTLVAMDTHKTPQVPKLLADAMLGKLARWLRLLGYNVIYMHADDVTIAARARAEGRILLTRDHELAKRRGLQVVFITSQELEIQLTQVVRKVGEPPEDVLPRCMHCNEPLMSISREEARCYVPSYVAKTQHTFRQCPKCNKVYWPGTHWDDIQERIRQALAATSST